MGCGFFVDWLFCGPIKLIAWILPGSGITTNVIAWFIMVLMTYFFLKFFGAIGGVLLIVVGLAGTLFSGGVTLVLVIIGFIATVFSKKAGIITGIFALLGLVCIFCSL
jgi:hypothetical protein